MNVIFLTIVRIVNVKEKGVYQDLIRKFRDEGHQVYIVCPSERKFRENTNMQEKDGVHILKVKTLNLLRTSIIEKGLGMLLLELQFKKAIKKYLGGIHFDLITYSTPPITLTSVIKELKKSNPHALSYLQLKDIFPQNAVDLGIMKTTGMKGVIYKYFRYKEKKLYSFSDYIGCMSLANVEYVLNHNVGITEDRVEVAPNSFEIEDNKDNNTISQDLKNRIREKYGLPENMPIFIYGGSLGKPQGIPFLIECLEANSSRDDCHFLVIGTGTELPYLMQWFEEKHPKNVTVMKGLPKAEYDELVGTCDVGMIFLDHRFTIPNYPSRVLSYLENKMPVLCATDPNTDMGRIAEENGYGYWCESNSVDAFTTILNKMIHANRKVMGEKGYQFLKKYYTVENTYSAIIKHFEGRRA